MSLVVSVPGSSANLGPGFDVLGMAVGLHVRMGVGGHGTPLDENHPARIAYGAAGGTNRPWFDGHLPSGRGLGFSGAAIVAGTIIGLAERNGVDPAELDTFVEANRSDILERATAIEGHPDNVAASLFGGVVAVAENQVIRIPVGLDARLLVWIPTSTTSTAKSRSRLSPTVAREDAVFNLGRVMLLADGLRRGDARLISLGTQDRLHQDARLQDAPLSREIRRVLVSEGAIASWLSGSGPTVAALCATTDVEGVRSRTMARFDAEQDGRLIEVAIDTRGACQAT